MARSRKDKVSLKRGVNDERFPKLLGLFFLLVALYLSIAFTSYLFTWQEDMDRVNRFSWTLLVQPEDMANWLGRLGAIVSHQFFFWGFGLASFSFVLAFYWLGRNRILRHPLNALGGKALDLLLVTVWMSIFLAFAFQSSTFPWGGAFGTAVVNWLGAFIGGAGVILFLLFSLVVVAVWRYNPDFAGMTPDSIKADLKKNFSLKTLLLYLRSRVDKRPFQQRKIEEELATLEGKAGGEAPTEEEEQEAAPEAPKTLRPRSKEEKEAAAEQEKESPKKLTRKEIQKKAEELTGNQLSFELSKEEQEQQEEGELEMEVSEEGEGLEPSDLAITEENRRHIEPYDPTLELSSFENPVLQLLESYEDQKIVIDRSELENNKDQIVETLLNYKIEIIKIKATIGPTVTLYEIIPAPGVRISKIKNLEDDIALSLSALGIRIIAPIPGRGTIGIEVPNRNKQIVALREVIHSEKFRNAKMDLPIALGKGISNEVFVADLAKMPHLLIAGATGQGKSVGINTILMSLLYKKHPSQLKLVLIDPKKVELSLYSRLAKHYLGFLPEEEEPIVTETSQVVATLHSLTLEMDERYNLLKKAQVRNLREYNQKFVQRRLNPEKGHKFMPYIVLVIDEFADLIMTAGKEVELPIGRLAQLARAVGIHLIIATQRPSVNIITGVIKANFPARLAFKVASKIDSRTILDRGGAEQLIGRGDMLLSTGGSLVRLQCAFVDTPEVERVIDYISEQRGYPEPFYLPAYGASEERENEMDRVLSELDENFEDAARLVVMNQQGSTSMIQRRLKLGYNRAGRIIDQLEATGIVGPHEGSKAREVLFHEEEELEQHLRSLRDRRLNR